MTEVTQSTDVSTWFCFGCAAASCGCFTILLFYIAPWLSRALFLGYRQLTNHEQRDFEARIGSAVHAIVVSAASVYVMSFDEKLYDITWSSPLALYVCSITMGYMVGDLLHMYWYYDPLWTVTFLAHHLLIIFVECVTIIYQTCLWFALYHHLAEMSTIFVHLRATLAAIGYDKSSSFYMFNGIVMTVVFFLVRVVSIPVYYYYLVYSVHVSEDNVDLGFIWYVMAYAGIPLNILNVFWFYKIILGVRKVLRETPLNKTQ